MISCNQKVPTVYTSEMRSVNGNAKKYKKKKKKKKTTARIIWKAHALFQSMEKTYAKFQND